MSGYDRTYRVLNSLEKNVREINNVVMPEVKKAIGQWKDRSTFSSLIVLGFIATIAIFAEIQTGILEFLIDPIIGPAIIVALDSHHDASAYYFQQAPGEINHQVNLTPDKKNFI